MSALSPGLPSIRVIVRGWLNCNQILLLGDTGHVVIDSGYSSCAEQTLQLLARPEYLGDQPLHRLINTHCHADHMGGNAALVRQYGCTVAIPAGDAMHVRPWDTTAFLIDYADHYVEPFDFDHTIGGGDQFEAGGLRWQALPAPGHDMNALMYWCAEEGVLITGDALWENGMGALFPLPSLEACTEAAHATLDRIASLAPRWIIPGHGAAFTDATSAVARARGRLDAFANDPAKNARHVLKALFSFSLLAKQRMRLSDVPSYVATVPCYRDVNERFIGQPLAQLADALVNELVKAKAIVVEDGWIRPVIAA